METTIASSVALAHAGFDLVHEFDATAVAHEPGLAMLAGGRRGLLIGNTRALWAPLVAAARGGALGPDPVERYTEDTIGTFVRHLETTDGGARVWYGHRRYDGAFVPLQRLAVATGLGALAASHLVIHPIYGPWFALRAIVVTAGAPRAAPHPIDLPCRCDDRCVDALAVAGRGGDWRAWLAVRDACSLRAHRYGEDQIRYHYTKVWRDHPE